MHTLLIRENIQDPKKQNRITNSKKLSKIDFELKNQIFQVKSAEDKDRCVQCTLQMYCLTTVYDPNVLKSFDKELVKLVHIAVFFHLHVVNHVEIPCCLTSTSVVRIS